MNVSPIRCFVAAVLVTLGLGLCLAAIAAGHADDAPGVGLIGFAAFLFFSFTAFGVAGGGRRA